MFAYYQKLHLKRFRGSSTIVGTLLPLSVFLAICTGVGFLLTYGYRVGWEASLVVVVVSFVLQIPVFIVDGFLERRGVSFFALVSVAGFVGWPMAAFAMFRSLPC